MSQKLTHSHDLYFKQSLKNPDVARDFLKAFLPAQISAKIDYSNIEIESSSFVDPELLERLSDIIFKVSIEEKDAYLYLLVEHQSSTDPDIVFRILGYSMAGPLKHAAGVLNSLAGIFKRMMYGRIELGYRLRSR